MAISIVKPSIGGDVGVWGTELNAALDALVSGVNQALNTLASVPGTYATQQALTIAVNGLSAQLAGKVDAAQLSTKVSQLPTVGSYSYDGSGRVTADPDGNTYTYNSDDTIATVTRGGVTLTASYGANGIAGWA